MEIIFTSHAKWRLKVRKLLEEEIMGAIKHPDETRKAHGKYFFVKKLDRGTIEICCERTESYIKVITIYWL